MSAGIVYDYMIKFIDKDGQYKGRYWNSTKKWVGVKKSEATRLDWRSAKAVKQIFNNPKFISLNEGRAPAGAIIVKEIREYNKASEE